MLTSITLTGGSY